MLVPRRGNFFDELFDDSMLSKKDTKFMKTDIKEKNGNYIFTIDVPGFEKEGIDIELDQGYLIVSAKTQKDINDEDEEENYVYRERYCGECSRSFYVGEGITEEDVKANFKNGILTITIPSKKETEKENKKHIQID